MTDTPPTPFAPFQPQPPAQPAPESKPPRQKRKATAETKAQPPATDVVRGEDTVKAPRQKRKAPTESKPSLKFDLQTILRAAAELNSDDMPLFEKLVGILQDAGKPGRERLLAAMGKIFA
jgi:hypothetical protein